MSLNVSLTLSLTLTVVWETCSPLPPFENWSCTYSKLYEKFHCRLIFCLLWWVHATMWGVSSKQLIILIKRAGIVQSGRHINQWKHSVIWLPLFKSQKYNLLNCVVLGNIPRVVLTAHYVIVQKGQSGIGNMWEVLKFIEALF